MGSGDEIVGCWKYGCQAVWHEVCSTLKQVERDQREKEGPEH
jgi:hypothetical protein